MAAPTFIAASTGGTDASGAWTATCHAPGAAGRIIILHVLQDGFNASTPTVTSVTNIEKLDGTDGNMDMIGASTTTFLVGGASVAYQQLYIGRSLSTSAPVVTGANAGGDDVYYRFYEFTNVSTGTTLATVIENIGGDSDLYASAGFTSTTISDTGVTTSGPDRLALQLVAANDDIAIDSFAGETGGNWVEAVAEFASSTGTDGMLQLQWAIPSIAAAVGTGSLQAIHGGTGTSEMTAQSFATVGDYTVTDIRLNLGKQGTPTDNLVVEIQTDSGSAPSGTAVGTSATINGASLLAEPGMQWVSFGVSASLSASTTYWVVVSRDGARDLTNRYIVDGVTPSEYSGGNRSTRDSGTWTASSTIDLAFAVGGAAGTIDGGSDTVVSAGWGVVGFALIGTTVAASALVLPQGFVNFNDPGVL